MARRSFPRAAPGIRKAQQEGIAMSNNLPKALTQLSEDERMFQQSVQQFAADRIAPLVRAMDEAAADRPRAPPRALRPRPHGHRGPRGVRRRRRHLLRGHASPSKRSPPSTPPSASSSTSRTPSASTPSCAGPTTRRSRQYLPRLATRHRRRLRPHRSRLRLRRLRPADAAPPHNATATTSSTARSSGSPTPSKPASSSSSPRSTPPLGYKGITCLPRRKRHARLLRRPEGRQARHPRLQHLRADLQRLPRARRQRPRRTRQRLQDRHRNPQRRPHRHRRADARPRPGRLAATPPATPASASSSASRSPSSRPCSSSSPRMAMDIEAARLLVYNAARLKDAGSRLPEGSRHGQATSPPRSPSASPRSPSKSSAAPASSRTTPSKSSTATPRSAKSTKAPASCSSPPSPSSPSASSRPSKAFLLSFRSAAEESAVASVLTPQGFALTIARTTDLRGSSVYTVVWPL